MTLKSDSKAHIVFGEDASGTRDDIWNGLEMNIGAIKTGLMPLAASND